MTATDGRWYRSMSPRERRTFWACFGGWATDAMDVQIYSLLIPVLLSVGLLASNAEAGFIGTVTLLCSAVGLDTWLPEADLRRRVLVDNPARLYGWADNV